MAMNLLANGIEGLKGTTAAAVTCFPYISPISNLLRLTINIRDASVRLTHATNHSISRVR
jgi:hypothetical protein